MTGLAMAGGNATVGTTLPQSPLALPGFVGRQRELGFLRERLATSLAGIGGVAMLVGEPGIGKTRTAQEFAAEAAAQGATVLWGRCFEGEWSPPFGPWVEALGRYARITEPEQLLRELGTGAAPVAQIVPAARAVLPEIPPPPPLGVEEERVRVEDAVTRFLLAVARQRAVVLVLDDLHWADAASLSLLRYLSRFLSEARVLIVGAYRDIEVDSRHPLTASLAELRRRIGVYGQCRVTGLTEAETAELIAQEAHRQVALDLTRTIHAQTDGNPFFTRELLHYLVEEGRLKPGADGWTATGELGELGVPEGVRHVIGRRLARLSETASRVLGLAAIFTSGFDFPVLQALTELEERVLLDALDEALASGLVRPVDGRRETYDFVHAIVRQTLESEWSPSRRVRLHRRLAEALERVHAGRELEHAADLAIQYHQSASLPGAAKGTRYARVAAQRARESTAREQAVAFLRMAHDLSDGAGRDERAAILCDLAVAEAEALLLDDARRTLERAYSALEENGATAEAIAGFLGTVAAALEDGGAPNAVWQPLVERGLELVADRRDLTWARLTLTLKPFAPLSEGAINASRWLGSDPAAVALARASGEDEDFARSVQPFDVRTPEETRALLARARRWERPAATIRALAMAGADWLYYHGGLREAIATFEELRTTSERFGSTAGHAEALIRLAIAQIALGEHDRARWTVAEADAVVRRLGEAHHLRASAAWTTALFAEHLDGDWAAVGAFWSRFVANPRAGENGLVVDDAALAAYAHARAGDAAEASRLLAELTPLLTGLSPNDWLVNGAVAFGAAAVWALDAVDSAGEYRRLARSLVAAGRGDYPGTSNELTIARMATLLGDRAEAGERFARARVAAAASGRRPLRGIVDHDEAAALLRFGGDARRAEALLDDAGAAFRELGMEGWARRVGELRGAARGRGERSRRPLPGGLTEREISVLQLVSVGCSDREIGERLFLSPRTVNAHVRNMLRKTDVGNRTELSVWGMEQGLVTRQSA